MKIYKNENGKWCYSFICNGQRVRKVVGLSKQECEAVACEARNKIKREGFGLKTPAKNVFFEDFAKEYLNIYAKQNKRSWRRDEVSIMHLNESFKGKYLAGITPDMIEKYKTARRAAVSPATVNLELACLKTIFNKALEWGKIEVNPAGKIKKFKLNNCREKILSGEEARRLIECAVPALRPVLAIALKTGMRRGEILALTWPAVNFIKSFILIENSKSGKSRKVPMSPAVREVLKAIPQVSDFIFYNPETKTHIKSVTTAFETARGKDKANLPGLRFHDLRHTFATWYMENGGDIVALSKILGHSSIQMTLRYCNPTEGGMLKAVEKMDGILCPQPGASADTLTIAGPALGITPLPMSN